MLKKLLLILSLIFCYPFLTFSWSHTPSNSFDVSLNTESECPIRKVALSYLHCVGNDHYNAGFEIWSDADSVDIYINDDFIKSEEANNGAFINNLSLNAPGATDQIKVCIDGPEECCLIYDYPKPNCGPDNCHIGQEEFRYDCISDDEYLVQVGLPNRSNGTISYELFIEGVKEYTFSGFFDDFEWSPGTILEVDRDYEYVIMDSANEQCLTSGVINYNGCGSNQNACSIESIEILSKTCNEDGTFDMRLNYTYLNPPNNSIDVFLDGEHYGTESNNGHLNLQDISMDMGSDENTLRICAYGTSDCCMTIDFARPDCLNEVACNIGDLQTTYNCGYGGEYESILVFDEEQESKFDLFVDEEYVRNIWPGQTSVRLGVFPNGTSHTYKILNRDNGLCSLEGDVFWDGCTLENQPCPEITAKIDSVRCHFDGSYSFTLLTRNEAVFNQRASATINGVEMSFYQSAVEVNATPDPDSAFDYLAICLDENKTCCKTIEIPQPACLSNQQCSIDVEIGYSCNNDQYATLISGLGNYVEGVDIYIDGELDGSYQDLNLINNFHLGWNTLGEYHTLKIVSQLDETCVFEKEFGIADCSEANPYANISIELENIECNEDGTYNLSIAHDFFEHGFECIGLEIGKEDSNNEIIYEDFLIEASNLTIENLSLNGDSSNYYLTFNSFGTSFALRTLVFHVPDCLTSGVDYTLIDEVVLSPNPSRDIININSIPNEITGLHIIDNMGRSMHQLSASSDMQLDISNYPEGIYFVQFYTNDNRVMSKRFVKID